jgi:hypothetical protein
MSTPADSANEALTAALPRGMTMQQAAILLAQGVCEAYAAYNNGSNFKPSLDGYNSFNQIWVFELDPNVNPFSTSQAQAKAVSAITARGKEITRVKRQPAAYARRPDGSSPPCVGPEPTGTPSAGYQLFGFTATANDNSHNLLALRGTVTLEEAGYDLLGWGDNTGCLLPSQNWWDKQSYGQVNSYLFAFYVNNYGSGSLAESCLNAIQATSANGLPWILGAHSLGGAMLSLLALDAVVSQVLSPATAFAMTFGSLHVGDQTFATNYGQLAPPSVRVANLCDFVPSMVSLEPVILSDPYVHVGTEATFVWQLWDDWQNHSLPTIYMPMVQNYWNIIKWGKRKYPQ